MRMLPFVTPMKGSAKATTAVPEGGRHARGGLWPRTPSPEPGSTEESISRSDDGGPKSLLLRTYQWPGKWGQPVAPRDATGTRYRMGTEPASNHESRGRSKRRDTG